MCIVCIVFGKDYRQYTFSMGSHSSNNQRWPNRMCKVLVIDPLMWLFTVTVPRLDKDDSYLSHGERKGEGREAVDSPLPPSPLLPVPMHRQQGGHVPRWRPGNIMCINSKPIQLQHNVCIRQASVTVKTAFKWRTNCRKFFIIQALKKMQNYA